MTYLQIVPANRYVYLHVRKDNQQVFYVGKGCGTRMLSTKSRNKHWHRVANEAGGFEGVKIIDGLTDDEAYSCERDLINSLPSSLVLCNLVAGGKGGLSPSAETREKQRAAKLGRKLSEEHKKKIGAAGLGKSYSGWKMPLSFCEKQSNRMKGRQVPEYVSLKISASKMGHAVTEETRLKISESKRGIPWTEARRLAQMKDK